MKQSTTEVFSFDVNYISLLQAYGEEDSYPLAVSWEGKEGFEYFTVEGFEGLIKEMQALVKRVKEEAKAAK